MCIRDSSRDCTKRRSDYGRGLLAALLCFLPLITLTPADAIAAPRSLGNDGLEGGQPGTIRGKVYDDHRHNPEIYNASTRLDPQDWPIAGVKMKAMLIKSDGTVIMSRDEFNNPVPFEATTNADGDYTFNFRPALREAYNLPADAAVSYTHLTLPTTPYV